LPDQVGQRSNYRRFQKMDSERTQRRDYEIAAIATELGLTLSAQWALALQQHQAGKNSQAQRHPKEILHP
jgi:hypothetical protein